MLRKISSGLSRVCTPARVNASRVFRKISTGLGDAFPKARPDDECDDKKEPEHVLSRRLSPAGRDALGPPWPEPLGKGGAAA